MSTSPRPTKYIFVTGGVVSSLGKGLAAASIGALLEGHGYKVALLKGTAQSDTRQHFPAGHGASVFLSQHDRQHPCGHGGVCRIR